jgi:LAGLIDADG DNA endonuclease family protein
VNGSSNYETKVVVVLKVDYMLEYPYRFERLKYLTLPCIMVIMSLVRTISRKGLSRENLGFYLAGFVEGEGSFNISLRKKADYKVNWQVVMSFNVSQKDPTLLYLLQKELGCGIIKVRKIDNLYSFDTTNPKDIIQKVIPYFQKYSMQSISKKKNFSIFCKIAQLMEKGEHRNLIGLRKILELRELINEGKGRKRKYFITSVFPN